VGYSLLIMKKMWGYFQLLEGKCGIFFVDNLENLRENLQYFLLIVWKA
jgi:Mg-chelatase subunit ChlI